MKKNLHRIDQSIRFVVAFACIYFGFIEDGFIQDGFLAGAIGTFGVINLLAASMRFCPFYHLAGINTIGQPKEEQQA